MKRNDYVRPAPDTRADHELAIAIARLERSEGGPAADGHRSAAAAQPLGQPGHMRVPSGGGAPGHMRVPSGGEAPPGHMRRPSAGQVDPSRLAPPLLPASAAKGGYKGSHAATAPPLQHGYSMQGEAPRRDGPAAAVHAVTLRGRSGFEAAIQNLNRAGAGAGRLGYSYLTPYADKQSRLHMPYEHSRICLCRRRRASCRPAREPAAGALAHRQRAPL